MPAVSVFNQTKQKGPKYNTTSLLITLNSNKAVEESEKLDLVEQFKDLVGELVTDEVAMDEVFGKAPWVHNVTVFDDDFYGEIGEKYHRFHLHIAIDVQHLLPQYSVQKLRARFQVWWNQNDRVMNRNRWSVFFKVGGGRANYNAKSVLWKQNDEMMQKISESDLLEIQRLSDNRTMMLMHNKSKTRSKRVLENSKEYYRLLGKSWSIGAETGSSAAAWA